MTTPLPLGPHVTTATADDGVDANATYARDDSNTANTADNSIHGGSGDLVKDGLNEMRKYM